MQQFMNKVLKEKAFLNCGSDCGHWSISARGLLAVSVWGRGHRQEEEQEEGWQSLIQNQVQKPTAATGETAPH